MEKLVECKACKEEVAKINPNCGEKNPTAIMKDTISKIVSFIIMVVILLSFSKDNVEANNKTDNKVETVKWYMKGTLHQSKVTDWKDATAKNKLATSADWVLALSKRIRKKVKQSGNIDEAKPFVTELVTCIDKTITDLDNSKTVAGPDTVYKSNIETEPDTKLFNIAANCMIVMGYLK